MSEPKRDAELSPTLTGYCDACNQYPRQTVRLRVNNETKVTLCSRCAITLAALVYREQRGGKT